MIFNQCKGLKFLIVMIIISSTGCVKVDLQTSESRLYQVYDKNQNHFFEENEFQEFLKILYQDEKFFKQLENKKITLKQYQIDEFKLYDTNNDEKLSYVELEQHWGRKVFKRIDINKNGYLEFDKEFGKFISKKAYKKYVDFNHKNSRDEKNNILPYDDFVRRIKNIINPNNDDKIEFQEFMNYVDIFSSCLFI
jgi:hypothetical protein